MPKELLIVPNERVDLDDFKYGTSTFTTDSIRSHIQRLTSGDYKGGFVLEGFRIEFTNTLREIVVHNGIAIDRSGRLVTAEDDPFGKNTDLQQSYTFSATGAGTVDHYVMVEFELADADLTQRVVWDPTFPNPDIIDSDNDLVPVPKGKEFSIDIPTRRAKLWKVISSTVGFEDSTDPNTIRIPIAVIPVTTDPTGINVLTADQETARATVMVKPGTASTGTLVASDSRVFADNAEIQILDYKTGTPRTFTVAAVPGQTNIPYAFNDRDNNLLESLTVDAGMDAVEVGDVIVSQNTASYLKEGISYDCRPMFFSFTDPTSADAEALSSTDQETRNLRFESGQSLIRHKNLGTAPWNVTTSYPSATATHRRVVTEFPERAENRLKQKQDFFRALAAVVREMKYGEQIDKETSTGAVALVNYGSVAHTNTASQFGFVMGNDQLPEGGLATDLIGADLTFISGGLSGTTRTVVSISAPLHADTASQSYIVEVSPAFAGIPAVTDVLTLNKEIDSTSKYVDNYRTGTLNEVYRARIDRVSNTWSNDLQERLRANKTPIVTVGDGFKSFGDYNGNAGLLQAFNDVYALSNGGVIHVKRGDYEIVTAGTIPLSSNTTVMGDGRGVTNIVFTQETNSFALTPETVTSTAIENVVFKDISITAADIADVTVAGKGEIFRHLGWTLPLENFQLDNVHFRGGSAYLAAGASPGLTYRYIGQILSNGNSEANKNITIKDSIFSVEGGGLLLGGCRGVKVQGCTFQSEDNDFTFVGMSEGIVLDGNDPSGVSGARYGSNVPALALGEVSISDCKFLGQQTNMSVLPGSVPVRGWIFTTPEYWGSPISVNNCQFVGDRVGLHLIASTRPTSHITVQEGAALHHASETVLNVTGCLIHSYRYGAVVAGGAVTLSSLNFVECSYDVVLGNDASVSLWNYAYLNAVWSLYSELNIDISGCNFYGKGSISSPVSTSTGIIFFRNDDASSNSKNVSVTGCKFESVQYAFYALDLSAYAHGLAAPNTQYDSIKITGNTFNDIQMSVFYSGTGLTNDSTETVRYWVIETFVYNNNTHNQCGRSISATYRGLLEFTAETVIVDGNSFIACQLSGGTAASPNRVFHFAGGFNIGTITNNKFVDCHNSSGTVNTIEISVASGNPDITINDNVIKHSYSSGSGPEVQNGIFFNVYVTTVATTAGYLPKLEMRGNKFTPYNPNFIVLSRQDVDRGAGLSYSRQWNWFYANVSDNHFLADVRNNTDFSDYGNWAQYNVLISPGFITVRQNYLGASKTNILSANQFAAVLDLRMFSLLGTHSNESCASVTGNTFKLSGHSWNDPANDMDCNSLIGIRITRWPETIHISGNTLLNAPVQCKWKFDTPRDGSGAVKGTTINITGNSYRADDLSTHCAIDVLPATGFAGKAALLGSSADNPDHFVHVTVNDNVIKAANTALDSTYNNLYGTVRLWPLTSHAVLSDNDSAGAPGQADQPDWYDEYVTGGGAGVTHQGLATSELCYDWQLQNNKLVNGVIYIDSESDGHLLGLLTQFQDAGGWHDFNGGTPTGTLINYGLVVVENNNKVCKSTALEAENLFGVTLRMGVSRIFLGAISSGTAPPPMGLQEIIGPASGAGMENYPADPLFSLTAPVSAISSLIVQNNSGVLGANRAKHAFTGSKLDI